MFLSESVIYSILKFARERFGSFIHMYCHEVFAVSIFAVFFLSLFVGERAKSVLLVLSNLGLLGVMLTIISILLMLTLTVLSLRKAEELEKAFAIRVIVVFSLAMVMFLLVRMLLVMYAPVEYFLTFLIIICWSLLMTTIINIIYYLTGKDIDKVKEFISYIFILILSIIMLPILRIINVETLWSFVAEVVDILYVEFLMMAIVSLGYFFFKLQTLKHS